jgi:hypothetical protein
VKPAYVLDVPGSEIPWHHHFASACCWHTFHQHTLYGVYRVYLKRLCKCWKRLLCSKSVWGNVNIILQKLHFRLQPWRDFRSYQYVCLNETYSRVWIGKHLSDRFTIKNGLKQVDALSPLLFNFALECDIRRVLILQNYMIDLIGRKP